MGARLGEAVQLVRERAARLAQIDLFPLDVEAPGVHPGEVEEVGRELGQAVDLLAHRCEKADARRLVQVLVGEDSRKPLREKSGVRSSCDALATNSFRAVSSCDELHPHSLERGGELSELVARPIDDGFAELPGRDPVRRPLEPTDAAGVHAGCQRARDRGERERHDGRLEEPALDQLHGRQLVGQRGREEDDLAPERRRRDLRVLAPAALDATVGDRVRLRCPQRDRVVLDVGRRVGPESPTEASVIGDRLSTVKTATRALVATDAVSA